MVFIAESEDVIIIFNMAQRSMSIDDKRNNICTLL